MSSLTGGTFSAAHHVLSPLMGEGFLLREVLDQSGFSRSRRRQMEQKLEKRLGAVGADVKA